MHSIQHNKIISHFYINFYCTDFPHGFSYFQCKFYNEDFIYHFFCCSYQVLPIITSATVSLLLCLHPVIPDFIVLNFTVNIFKHCSLIFMNNIQELVENNDQVIFISNVSLLSNLQFSFTYVGLFNYSGQCFILFIFFFLKEP